MRPTLIRFSLVALLPLIGGVACKSNHHPGPTPDPAEVPPSEYQNGPADEAVPETQETGGRFGYTGETNEAPTPPEQPPRNVRDIEPTDSGSSTADYTQAPTPPAPTKRPPSVTEELPYATPVPGDPLAVTFKGLGPISIEMYDATNNPTGQPMKRGTKVKIPDPNNPGKELYFKVP